jgi:hypothetical protein
MANNPSPVVYVDQLHFDENEGVQSVRFEIEYGRTRAEITILPGEPVAGREEVRREFERLANALLAAVESHTRVVWRPRG